MKTSIKTIHQKLKVDMIDDRANNLFVKFLKSKTDQPTIANEIIAFLNDNSLVNKRFTTPLDNFFST